MSITWVVETPRRFNDATAALVAEVKRQNGNVIPLSDPIYLFAEAREAATRFPKELDELPEDALVMAQGSLGLCRTVRLGKPKWRPGAWDNEAAVHYTNYKKYVGSWMLNRDALVLTWGALRANNKEELFRLYGPRLFSKPAACNKLYTGCVIDREGWDEFVKHVDQQPGFVKREEEVIVGAAVPKLDSEFRFFVRPGEVIAGSQYRRGGRNDIQPGWESGAYGLAYDVACTELRVDPIYVVDICRVGDEYKVLEFGTFSPCGLYAPDMRALVAAVHEEIGKLG